MNLYYIPENRCDSLKCHNLDCGNLKNISFLYNYSNSILEFSIVILDQIYAAQACMHWRCLLGGWEAQVCYFVFWTYMVSRKIHNRHPRLFTISQISYIYLSTQLLSSRSFIQIMFPCDRTDTVCAISTNLSKPFLNRVIIVCFGDNFGRQLL